MDSSDPEGHLQHIWTKVAQTHSKNHIEKESFNELREVILQLLTIQCDMNEEQQEAWKALFDLVYGIVFQKLDEIYEN